MTITVSSKLCLGLVWYFPGRMGVCGCVVVNKSKANLAQFQMNLPAGAKLGNIANLHKYWAPQMILVAFLQ